MGEKHKRKHKQAMKKFFYRDDSIYGLKYKVNIFQ